MEKGEVREPMGGNAGLMMRGRGDTADELFTVFDVPVVVSGVFVFLHNLPAEEVGIELAGASLVGRIQVSPAKRPVRAHDPGSRVVVGLPNREDGAGGILQNGHAAGIENVERRGQDRAAQFLGAGRGGVSALHSDVKVPVGGGKAAGELFGTNPAT